MRLLHFLILTLLRNRDKADNKGVDQKHNYNVAHVKHEVS